MTDLREALERLAERGTRVGPEAVFDRAIQAARTTGSAGDHETPSHRKRRIPQLVAAACVLALLSGLLVFGSDGKEPRRVVVGPPGNAHSTNGPPRRGGQISYGLEAETGDWCLPSAQLSSSGIEVVSAIYDTLTIPTRKADGSVGYAPYLAKSVTHNAAYTVWSIKLRSGIRFHDGEPLDAAAVKENLDAYRGRLATTSPLLFTFILQDIADVQVVDSLTVRVTTSVPWVAFDAFLWSSGRLGIAAPQQLEHPATCGTKPIGTGPFRFVRWNRNSTLVVERNPSFWRRDSGGRHLPYLDRITFRPIPNARERVKALEDGRVDVIENTDPLQTARLRKDAKAGTIRLAESDSGASVNYALLNSSQAPFNDVTARLAVAHAINFAQVIAKTQAGVVRRAVQPFTEENIAYVDPARLDFPDYNPTQARKLVRAYERKTGKALRVQWLTTEDAASVNAAELVRKQAAAVGISVVISHLDVTALTNAVIDGKYNAAFWRSLGGGDPDLQAVNWQSTLGNGSQNIVDFGRLRDPEIDRLLTEGRSQSDPRGRIAIYRALTNRFAQKAYNLWGWYTRFSRASVPTVKGLEPPPLPGGAELASLAGFQPVVGLWRGR